MESKLEGNIEQILQRSRAGGWNPFNYYNYPMDSYFHDQKSIWYLYQNQPYKGEEINYYLQGILHRHYRLPLHLSGSLVRLNNWRYWHDPTEGEYAWTVFGYYEYYYWKNK